MTFDKDKDYLESNFLPGQGTPNPSSNVPTSNVPPPAPQPPYAPPYQRPRRKSSGWRIFWGVLFGLSLLANIGMFIMLIMLSVLVAGGHSGTFTEAVLRPGPGNNKIVVISLEGMIDDGQAQFVRQQLDAAREDNNVRALILRVNSPGGTISGSDRIYQDVLNYHRATGQPTVAFMQGVAASGGYYASVACDRIVAEPTTITGSIGVIMSYFVFQDLLENKLGVQPVFLTAGEKKDWPSSFRAPKDEELDYIEERLLVPAYERFVEIVRTGRAGTLSIERVRALADGSIYGAPKALEEKLIDKVGYLDDAVAEVKAMANIKEAQVVEYRRMFSFMNFLNAKTEAPFKLNRKTLYELSEPQVLYMWSAY